MGKKNNTSEAPEGALEETAEETARVDENTGAETGQETAGTTEQQGEGNGEKPDSQPLNDEQSGTPDTATDGADNAPSKPSSSGKAVVVSEGRKGKTIFAASGKPIVFDDEGKAEVEEADALYLKNCPGFKVG